MVPVVGGGRGWGEVGGGWWVVGGSRVGEKMFIFVNLTLLLSSPVSALKWKGNAMRCDVTVGLIFHPLFQLCHVTRRVSAIPCFSLLHYYDFIFVSK